VEQSRDGRLSVPAVVRQAAAPLHVAFRRIAARPVAALLTALGVAIGTGALAAALVSNVVVEDRAVADAVSRLAPGQRVVSVSWVGSTAGGPSVDRQATSALDSLDLGAPVRVVAFRTTRLGTKLVRLAALDRPSELLDLRSGRMPSRCAKDTCELVALDSPSEQLGVPGFAFVGLARWREGGPADALTGAPSAGAPILVANGIAGLSARPELSGLFRTLTWAVVLNADELDAETVSLLPRRIGEIDTALRTQSSGFAVQAPLDDLAAATDRAKRASRRQLLVTGGFTALFLAFVVLAASRIRRRVRATRHRLRRLRGQRWQIALETFAYAGLIALPAVLVGWLGGVSTGAVLAAVADRPIADVLRRSALNTEGVLALSIAALVAVTVLVATVRARTLEIRGRRITAPDMAAAGVIAVVATAVAAGETDSASLARDDRVGAVLLALPVLLALAGGLLSARLLGPALLLCERIVPSSRISLRLALLSLVRNPGTAVVTVACLAVTAAMAVFAVSYDATLERNQRDTAAYAVPLDYGVTRDDARARSFGSRTDLSGSYEGREPVGVVRVGGEAPSLNRRERLTTLAIPAAAIPALRWRDDFSESSQDELARAVSYEGAGLAGVEIPAGAEELILPRALQGDPIRLSASIRRPDGGFSVLDLVGPSRSSEVRAFLSPRVRGGMLVALTLAFPPGEEFTAAHRATGSRPTPDVFVRGTLRLGRPRVRTNGGVRPLKLDYRDWVRSDGSGGGGSAASLELRYFLTQERAFRIRPRQSTDRQPIPVIASTSIAAAAGSARVLPVSIGQADIKVRIAASANRFPTLDGDFLVVDRTALETAANAATPGTAVADEVWLRGRPGAEPVLRRLSPIPVRVSSRSAIERRLHADPVSRAASISLLVTALLAAVLAIVGVLLALSVDARDDAAELFDLEALGVEPAGLARHLWLRSGVLLTAGLLGGLAAGAATALLVTDVVAVTANATTAEPPLVPVLDWLLLGLGLGAFALIAIGAAGVLARAQFRAPVPDRPGAT
jgi:hypothetical protein